MPARARLLLLSLLLPSSLAHYAPALPDSRIARPSAQFGLPFAGEPGPNTWLLGQVYGNTVGAYNQRRSGYGAGQGIHFGLDFSAKCGTPVLAIADGRVSEVDGPHGSAPHNLVLEHAGNLSSLYGHLQERSKLKVGQLVKRGQPIGKSGDSQFTCRSAPHLHLEIRDASHQRFFNPIAYIQADWDTLTLGSSRTFARDLDAPRRWQSLLDQPQARRGGRLLNDYAKPWPPGSGSSVPLPPVGGFRDFYKGFSVVMALKPGVPLRLTEGGCCAGHTWLLNSRQVVVLDRPTPQSRTGFYSVTVDGPRKSEYVGPPAFLTQPPYFATWPQGRSSVLEGITRGERFTLPTQGVNPLISSSGNWAGWTVAGQEGNFDRRKAEIYVASLSSRSLLKQQSLAARLIATRYGGGLIGWMNEAELLISGKKNPADPVRALEVLNVETGTTRVLTTAQSLRSISLDPNGKFAVYTVAFDPVGPNGQFILDLSSGQKRVLERYSSVRWRGDTLLSIPLEPGKPQRLLEVDPSTGGAKALLTLPRKVTQDDWSVSPDGKKMVFRSAGDLNLYALELP